jgi:hypothetical protein
MDWRKLKTALGISRSESVSDHDLWKKDCYAFKSSQTSNIAVLNIYNEILEHQFYDSDYWSFTGNYEIVFKLQHFNVADWADLEQDLANWKIDQIEILSDALTEDYYQNNGAATIINQRSCLYGYILTIVDLSSAIELMENFEFISKGEPKPKPLLEKLNLLHDKIKSTVIDNPFAAERLLKLKEIMNELNR